MMKRNAERQRGSPAASDLEARSNGLVPAAPTVTREVFSAKFEHYFRRVYAYVSRRVDDSKSCQRVVSEVLSENLDLLVDLGDETRAFSRLKASSDRLIEMESATSISVSAPTTQT